MKGGPPKYLRVKRPKYRAKTDIFGGSKWRPVPAACPGRVAFHSAICIGTHTS